METMFDFISAVTSVATVSLYALRLQHEQPPASTYILITLVAIVGAWLGNNGGGVAAVALLIAASFLLLHLASEPFREDASVDCDDANTSDPKPKRFGSLPKS